MRGTTQSRAARRSQAGGQSQVRVAPPAPVGVVRRRTARVIGPGVGRALLVLLPPARATQLVRAQLARSLTRDVRFEQVSLSLWPPVRLSVQRFELAEPGGFEHGAAFSAAALDLDLDVLALLAHRVRVVVEASGCL